MTTSLSLSHSLSLSLTADAASLPAFCCHTLPRDIGPTSLQAFCCPTRPLLRPNSPQREMD
jgi:hypothetical protein